jgi:catechol 2,3-dioxygenase-like lactoylglutathione lyase family enzyme
MFSHIMIGSNDIGRSKKFYDAVFAAMGAKPATEDAKGRLAYSHNGGRFMVSKPIDGKPATHANGGTIGFSMSGPGQVDAWHKAGVAKGGTLGGAGQLYLAYL